MRFPLFTKMKQEVNTLRTKKEQPKVTVTSIFVFAESWCFLFLPLLCSGGGGGGGVRQV